MMILGEISAGLILVIAGLAMILLTSPQILWSPISAWQNSLSDEESSDTTADLEIKPISPNGSSGMASVLILLISAGMFFWFGVLNPILGIKETSEIIPNAGLSIIQTNSFSRFLTGGLLILGFLQLLIAIDHARKLRMKAIYFAEILFCLGGVLLMTTVQNLFILFVLYELVSLGIGILISFCEEKENVRETVKNYWMNQVVSTVLFLWGVILLWGIGKSFDLVKLKQGINLVLSSESPVVWGMPAELVLVGALVLLVGSIGMKMGLIPFQSGTIFLRNRVTPCTQSVWILFQYSAGMILLHQLVRFCFSEISGIAQLLFIVVSGATILIPAILAIGEKEWSKLFSCLVAVYAGFLILNLASGVNAETSGISNESHWLALPSGTVTGFYFLFVFLLASCGLSGIITGMKSEGFEIRYLEDFRGLYHVYRPAAICFTVLLIGLAGFPLTGGFWSHFFILANSLSGTGTGETIAHPNPVFIVLMFLFLVSSLILAVILIQLAGSLYFQMPVRKSWKREGGTSLLAGLTVVVLMVGLSLCPASLLRSWESSSSEETRVKSTEGSSESNEVRMKREKQKEATPSEKSRSPISTYYRLPSESPPS